MLDRNMFRTAIVVLALGSLGAAARAQFTGIYTFNGNYDGCCSYYADYLAQGTDGNLHGTMPVGAWAAPYGSWFDYTPGTSSPLIHELQSSLQPEEPYSGLTLGVDGNLYGGSTHGGASTGSGSTYGALFRISNGVMTTVYKFTGGTNGSYPYAPPIQAPDGNLYGVTYDPATTGYVYQVVMSNGVGTLGWIHALPSGSRAALIMATDGNLYGTVPYGGFTINGKAPLNNSGGAIFQVTLGGALTGIYNITGSSSNNNGAGDGFRSWGAVMQASDGNLYGATTAGGAYAGGTLYKVALNGTGFTVIHNFQYNDGTAPSGGLVEGSDGYLYGLASASGYLKNIIIPGGGFVFTPEGTLFKVDTAGVNFVRLYTFFKGNVSGGQGSGNNPFATPVLHTSGVIYGLTQSGGTGPSGNYFGTYDDGGELFSYHASLEPFVSVVSQRTGKIGDRISIIGQGFLNTTGVLFGGVAASSQKFQIIILSDNFLTVVVPFGAKSGKITVQESNTTYTTINPFKIQCSFLYCP
ncbi:MAG TPA: choice-of-anchor tandem repeat GloVer-containing protein [Terracidiphilus sp.]